MDSKKNKQKELFIQKCIKKYGDAYNYDKVDYKGSNIKVIIICNEHNYEFEQEPSAHIRGRKGCLKCNGRYIYTFDEIVEEFNIIHNYEYTYYPFEYINKDQEIIIGSKYGDFKQSIRNHLSGQGSPNKPKKPNYTNDIFIQKADKVHNGKYDYRLIDYENNQTILKIVCGEHGEFEQRAVDHLRGKGCPKCGIESRTKKLALSNDIFIQKADEVHNGKYNYQYVDYQSSKQNVIIDCPEHGLFKQKPFDHLDGHGCPKCVSTVSSHELEISEFLSEFSDEIITSKRNIIPPLQLDIFLPKHNIGIEFNGLYFHSEEFKDKKYHLNKTNRCNEIGVRLIHIFEDQWLFKKDIVKSRLLNLIGKTPNKIFARKTEIVIIGYDESKVFLENNHIQGNVNGSIRLGLKYEGNLVSLMVFNRPRIGIGKKYNGYELSRFCNKLNTNVVGGASKLFNYFIKNYEFDEIVSYADLSWSNGDLYKKLGFKSNKQNRPNYSYVIGKNRKHRFNFRKAVLIDQGYDPTMSESEIMKMRNIYKIYDCGTLTFKYKKTS